ncbi:MAG: 5'-methylthioadenosine/adenosylhomocysteine nucleosidase [Ruminococcaceae bacterium]|nr:5'-methylthioadenosine/adenosylhomocysteine nucleosidase [Oscillospiraceae bacterium]
MIGVIGAMHIEVETIKSLMENKTAEKIGGVEFVKGTLHGREIVIAVCGIGKVAAAMCTQIMILKYSPECIINTGVGGSLSTRLAIGDIAVAESLVQHDMDTSPLGDPVGLISGLNLVNIPADKRVAEVLLKGIETLDNVKGMTGVIASGDQFIASDEKKKFITDNFGAIVCEMEGASIAQVCFSNGVPFGVVRAVSDCADGSSHMDYGEFLPVAAANAAKLIEYFAMNA